MNQSHWLILVIVATMVCNGSCRPREADVTKVYPVYRSEKQLELETPNRSEEPTTSPETKSETEKPPEAKINIESIATVARASSDGPSMPTSHAIGQLIDTVGQMDIRTPPKLKEIIKEKVIESRRDVLGETSSPLPYTFVYDDDYKEHDKYFHSEFSEGKASHINVNVATDEGVKGIAIPVVMDEMDYETSPSKKLQKIPEVPKPVKEEKKKNSVAKSQPTTTPSSGLSTWILLSDNKEVTTASPKRNSNKKDNGEDKKKNTASSPTTKKPIKLQTTTLKAATQGNKKVTQKPNVKKPESETGSMSALEALVKNQKKNVATTAKPKPSEDTKSNSQKKTDSKKKVTTERLEVAESKNKFEIDLAEPKNTLPTNLPITVEEKGVTVPINENESQPTTETSVEGTTKKKTSSKKKKKNKNKRRKTSSADTGVEAKIPSQPMGSQIYNFLSREIVPTVGLGLIGVALTAGLASFLGYNPFGSTTVPLRRTYESHHGYSPNNYYNYNSDYGDGGQSEEVLFREVLSGMPEDSRYGITHTDPGYPEAYNRQDQVYDTVNNPVYPTTAGSKYNSDQDVGNYDATYPQDYSSAYGSTYDSQDKKYMSDSKDKYPVYNPNTGTSFVYPETTGMTSPDKASRVGSEYVTQSSPVEKYSKASPDTIERQPEALYRVAGESDYHYRNGESTIQGVNSQNSWHRIGTPMESPKVFPHLEPGPRSLDLTKVPQKTEEKKRVRRAAESVIQKISPKKRTKKANDVENEIDFEESISEKQNSLEDFSSTTMATRTTTYFTETTTSSPDMENFSVPSTTTTTEEVKEASSSEPPETYAPDNDGASVGPSGASVLDVLKRLAQFKLRLGLNFLRSTTDMFSRYLDDIQRRVDESFTNTTTTTVHYNKRSPWSRIFSRFGDYRRRRSVLDENQKLSDMLPQEDKTNERFSKSTKKDLRPSNKVFHQKKTSPKKYKSN